METDLAYLLKRYELTETSYIVHWLGRDLGKFKTVAKGARRPKSPFAGRLDLFYLNEIRLTRSRSSDLHQLRETRLVDSHAGLRTDYFKVRTAAYLTGLIDDWIEAESPVPEIHALLGTALGYLESNPPTSRLVRRFERRLTELLGQAHPEWIEGHTETLPEIGQRLHKEREHLLADLP